MVAKSFAVLAFGAKALDLPGLAQLASRAGVARSLAFVVHEMPPSLRYLDRPLLIAATVSDQQVKLQITQVAPKVAT